MGEFTVSRHSPAGTGRRLGGSGKKDKRAHYRADADWVKPRDGGSSAGVSIGAKPYER